MPAAKLEAYLLNPRHPTGGAKARRYLQRGFRRDDPEALRQALLALARSSDVAELTHAHGRKFVGTGDLDMPSGRALRVVDVWLLDHGSSVPRLVTAYPA